MISKINFKPNAFYFITSPEGHTNRYKAIEVPRGKHVLLISGDTTDFYLSYWLNENYKIKSEQLEIEFKDEEEKSIKKLDDYKPNFELGDDAFS